MYEGKNWVQAFMLVEIAVNSVVSDLTMLSPVHVTFDYPLRMPLDHLDGLHPVQAA